MTVGVIVGGAIALYFFVQMHYLWYWVKESHHDKKGWRKEIHHDFYANEYLTTDSKEIGTWFHLIFWPISLPIDIAISTLSLITIPYVIATDSYFDPIGFIVEVWTWYFLPFIDTYILKPIAFAKKIFKKNNAWENLYHGEIDKNNKLRKELGEVQAHNDELMESNTELTVTKRKQVDELNIKLAKKNDKYVKLLNKLDWHRSIADELVGHINIIKSELDVIKHDKL